MKKTLIPLVFVAACASSYQSARVVEPGKTQVTAGLGRTTSTEGDFDEGVWSGDLQVRTGLANGVDGGLRLVRTPGGNGASFAGVDAKYEIVPGKLSVALPVGVAWAEEGDDFGSGIVVVSPTVFAAAELSPTMELVAAPRVFVFLPDGETDNSEVDVGGSVGVRWTNAERTWALHPELGILHVSDDSENNTFITFGLGVAVGN